jgi:serine kinase of HPr protein (carbohydrate metabolism regulator)
VETLIHGTCIALGERCALLRGPCGAGKSDLALRFLFLPAGALGASPALIADDQVILRRSGERITASCPPALAGKIEVRGAGIAQLGYRAGETELKLVADLDRAAVQSRYPEGRQWEAILGLPVQRIALDPFEISAPIKLALVLQELFANPVD